MKRIEEIIDPKLTGLNFETIENSAHSIFVLSKDLKLIYFNPAWFDFAKKNNGEPGITLRFPIGTPIESAISGDIKDYYIENYLKTLRDLKVWKHEYECSTPKLFRKFYQDSYPLKNGEGIVVVNSLKIEKPYDLNFQKERILSLSEYIDTTGLITQCSNCRKTQRAKEVETWDWIPELVSDMPLNVSHSICPICFDYYWTYRNRRQSES